MRVDLVGPMVVDESRTAPMEHIVFAIHSPVELFASPVGILKGQTFLFVWRTNSAGRSDLLFAIKYNIHDFGAIPVPAVPPENSGGGPETRGADEKWEFRGQEFRGHIPNS